MNVQPLPQIEIDTIHDPCCARSKWNWRTSAAPRNSSPTRRERCYLHRMQGSERVGLSDSVFS